MRRLVTLALMGMVLVSPALAQQQPARPPAPVAAPAAAESTSVSTPAPSR